VEATTQVAEGGYDAEEEDDNTGDSSFQDKNNIPTSVRIADHTSESKKSVRIKDLTWNLARNICIKHN